LYNDETDEAPQGGSIAKGTRRQKAEEALPQICVSAERYSLTLAVVIDTLIRLIKAHFSLEALFLAYCDDYASALANIGDFGIPVGTDAGSIAWKKPLTKITARVGGIRSAGVDLPDTICLFSTAAITICAHIVQLYDPSDFV